jgi:hypothetical protein
MHASSVAGSNHGDDVEENGQGLQDITAGDEDFIHDWSLSPPPTVNFELCYATG